MQLSINWVRFDNDDGERPYNGEEVFISYNVGAGCPKVKKMVYSQENGAEMLDGQLFGEEMLAWMRIPKIPAYNPNDFTHEIFESRLKRDFQEYWPAEMYKIMKDFLANSFPRNLNDEATGFSRYWAKRVEAPLTLNARQQLNLFKHYLQTAEGERELSEYYGGKWD